MKLQNGWAYRRPHVGDNECITALDRYLFTNHYRPLGGLYGLTPMQRLAL